MGCSFWDSPDVPCLHPMLSHTERGWPHWDSMGRLESLLSITFAMIILSMIDLLSSAAVVFCCFASLVALRCDDLWLEGADEDVPRAWCLWKPVQTDDGKVRCTILPKMFCRSKLISGIAILTEIITSEKILGFRIFSLLDYESESEEIYPGTCFIFLIVSYCCGNMCITKQMQKKSGGNVVKSSTRYSTCSNMVKKKQRVDHLFRNHDIACEIADKHQWYHM